MATKKTKRFTKKSFDVNESFVRAVTGQSLANFPAIIDGFLERGIPEDQILPRENVFTYNVWRDKLGRQVRKGEKGVRIATVRKSVRKVKGENGGEEEKAFSFPGSAVVFHVSQTDAIEGFVSQTPGTIVDPEFAEQEPEFEAEAAA